MITQWRLRISVSAGSERQLIRLAKRKLSEAMDYLNKDELPPVSAGGGGSSIHDSCGFSVDVIEPIKDQIASLRAEADRLEAILLSGMPNETE